MHKKIPTLFAFVIVAIFATFLLVTLIWQRGELDVENMLVIPSAHKNKISERAECTTEAKICPDGSAVGRSGPNCEFSPCPSGNSPSNIVGNDRDEHGCIPSAGYTWCEEKQKCLRIWEESCFKSGLKTYRSDKFGYVIEYPSNWYIYDNVNHVFIQKNKEESGMVPGPHADALEIEISSVKTGEVLETTIDRIKQSGVEYQQEEYFIGGIKGVKIVSVCDGIGCGAPEWAVIKNNYLYHFNSNLGYSVDFDQILSSLKFL
jgi:hypothetical protein